MGDEGGVDSIGLWASKPTQPKGIGDIIYGIFDVHEQIQMASKPTQPKGIGDRGVQANALEIVVGIKAHTAERHWRLIAS